MNIKSVILLSLLLVIGCEVSIDSHTDYNEMSKIIEFTDLNLNEYLLDLTKGFPQMDMLSKGDYYLIQARLKNDKNVVCKAIPYYLQYNGTDEEKAILYETIGSLDCGEDIQHYYLEASKIWEELGNTFRAELDKSLAYGDEQVLHFSIDPINPVNMREDYDNVIIGGSRIVLGSGDTLLAQTERVTRDWLSGQLSNPHSHEILTVFSEKGKLSDEELREDIGWHEGARVKDFKEVVDYGIVAGTLAAKYNEKWYAPNELGVFMFEIPYDKIVYPTTRFLREDLALVMDVHGVNMMVEQAIRENVSVVIGCCDFPGKIKAAKYLSDKGKKVLCFTDRFVPDLIGEDENVIGSAPYTLGDEIVIGNRPITISKSDIILAEDKSVDVQQYYDTAARYFSYFSQLQVTNYSLSKDDTVYDLVDYAEELDVDVIGARVYSLDDYTALKNWLEKDSGRKLILFHSMAYPYGKIIFDEFEDQVTFGDINPIYS